MKSGVLIIDKDKGITSRDVVNIISKKFGIKRVGHTGTLDPIATGVLVICVNEATKVIEFITSDEKEYVACVKVGLLTDTLDVTGNIIKENDKIVEENQLRSVLESFCGEYLQEVPLYSAVRVKGKRLYDYARSNEIVELPKRMVNIKEIELLDFTPKEFKFRVVVSKGTYIRSLIRDIGDRLNVLCTMSELRRTRQGIFKIDDAVSVCDVDINDMMSIDESLSNYHKIIVDDDTSKKVRNGVKIEGNIDGIVRVVDKDNQLLALYRNDSNNNLMRAIRVFHLD